jgi:hypothetical protein
MHPERKPSFWERLDTPTKVIAAIAASIAALVGAGGVVAGAVFFGGDDKTVVVRPTLTAAAATPLAGERIKTCMERHHLRSPRISVGARTDANITFKRCDWPPVVESSTDGYTEVWNHKQDLPRPASDPYSVVSTFRAPCDQLDVTFVLDHMETRQFTSRRLDRGRLYQVDGVQNPDSLDIRMLGRVPPT